MGAVFAPRVAPMIQHLTVALALCIPGLAPDRVPSRAVSAQGPPSAALEAHESVRGSVRLYDTERTMVADYHDLRSALEAADPGALLVLEPGLYSGPDNRGLLVEKDVHILGRTGPERTVIDCRGQDRAFDFLGADVFLQGVTIRRGRADEGGAIRFEGGSLWMRDVVLEENEAELGGALLSRLADLRMTQCRASRNVARDGGGGGLSGNGGALAVLAGATIGDCLFEHNVAERNGGAILVATTSGVQPVELVQSTVVDNCADSGGGGGIFVFFIGAVSLERCRVVGNEAGADGGGLGMTSGVVTASLRSSLVARNTAAGRGGGIDHPSATALEVLGCTVVENASTGTGAGGIRASSFGGGPITIADSIVRGNTSDGASALVRQVSNTGSALDPPSPLPTTSCNVEGTADFVTNIDADPLFVDAVGGEFHILAGSPCIDAGSASAASPWDLDGDPRLSGSAVDIGMDEVPSMPAAVTPRSNLR